MVLERQETGNIENKKQPENPFLVVQSKEINGEKTTTEGKVEKAPSLKLFALSKFYN